MMARRNHRKEFALRARNGFRKITVAPASLAFGLPATDRRSVWAASVLPQPAAAPHHLANHQSS
jgi:hypothetical protein